MLIHLSLMTVQFNFCMKEDLLDEDVFINSLFQEEIVEQPFIAPERSLMQQIGLGINCIERLQLKPQPWKCKCSRYKFCAKKHLYEHIRYLHRLGNYFECPASKCQERFTTTYLALDHLYSNHILKICCRRIWTEDGYSLHKSLCKNKPPIKKRRLYQKKSPAAVKNGESQKFKCLHSQCEHSFETIPDLLFHINNEHDPLRICCNTMFDEISYQLHKEGASWKT